MQNRIDIYKNGVLLPQVESCSVTLAMGGSSASITATPGHSIAIAETDYYDVALVYEVAGNDSPQWLMKRAHAVANQHSFAANPLIRGFGEDGVQEVRSLQLVDQFAKFRDRAPSRKIIRRNTTAKKELRWISGQSGMPNIVSLLPDVKIERIDYVPESTFWASIQPWIAPWQPLEVLDPVRGELRLYDPTLLRSTAPAVNRKLTLSEYNDIQYSSTIGEDIITQARIDYLLFGWAAGSGPSESLVATIRNGKRTDEEDGSKTYVWTEAAVLKVDPDDPDEEPRVVPVGSGQSRTRNDKLIIEEVTRYEYADNYTRPIRTTSTSRGLATIPGVGDVEDVELSQVVTEQEYTPDELVPGRYFLTAERRRTSGLYVFPSIPVEQDTADRDAALAAATPVEEASHAGAVATTANAAQEWATGLMFIETTTRQRLDAHFLAITYTKTDVLRKRVVEHWSNIEQGDNATIPAGYAKHTYVRRASSYGERAAIQIDGTRIGLPLARALATRMLALAANPRKTLSLAVTIPNYTRLRLGYLVSLDADALPEMAGPWLLTQVTFRMDRAAPQEAAVSDAQVQQELALSRHW